MKTQMQIVQEAITRLDAMSCEEFRATLISAGAVEGCGRVLQLTPVARFVRDCVSLKGKVAIDISELLIQELDSLSEILEKEFSFLRIKSDS
ncbi:hypothetical protein [Klebsiella grimontii]|uniref:hypothetical protein n=1 Tax=Klebsiella grimontii TaxID=2058152 RepID=UPI000DD3E406|nr:hypothetical protein [Klebsiella grimontii]